MRARLALTATLGLLVGPSLAEAAPPVRPAWAIALHGGAGSITADPKARQAYEISLRAALQRGREMLADGADALDVVEKVIRQLEDDPLFNAGRGAVLNAKGTHELDASIMDGRNLSCGAVAGVTRARHPISVARLVMTRTRHVLLAGPGADAFAARQKVTLVPNDFFTTPRRLQQLKAKLGSKKGTVGVVVRDAKGHLAAGTSTGGLTGKRYGRVGDSPVIGAGTYADDRSVAVSCTGTGEEFIRHAVAHSVADRVRLLGETVTAAARHVVEETLQPGDGGLIAVGRDGEIAMVFNTPSMLRAAADASGRLEIGIGR